MKTGTDNESVARVDPALKWKAQRGLILVVVTYVLATAFTNAFFMADTVDYADSIVLFDSGGNTRLWEFAHLFWRPLGWALFRTLYPLTSLFVGKEPRLNALLVLISMSWLAGLLCVVLFHSLLRLIVADEWTRLLVVIALIFAQGFLNFAQSGSSYISGLAMFVVGLFLLLRYERRGNEGPLLPFINGRLDATSADGSRTRVRALDIQLLMAGFSLACAVCFWVMYLYALPAALLAPLFFFGLDRQRVKVTVLVGLICALFTVTFYVAALHILHISSIPELQGWLNESVIGNNTRGLLRMLFGLARSFVNMGNDGRLFKRYLLHDPFNPVSFWDLVRLSLWKFALFYAFLIALALALLPTQAGRRVLGCIMITALPTILFAIFFDGGAIERYLPLYPLILLALAVALDTKAAGQGLKWIMAVFVGVMIVNNCLALSKPNLAAQERRVAARVASLQPVRKAGSRVVLVTWLDDVVNFNRSFPFDPVNLGPRVTVSSLVTPGTMQVLHWREEFAALALQTWERGGDVWVSQYVLSPQPEADWNWVEGDDPNVHWTDFPAFFQDVELGEGLGGEDGFRRVIPSDHNEQLFRRYAAAQ